METEHPALAAARNSWSCVQRKAREEWLALLAEVVRLEDPIGVAPTNPTGQGFRGRAEAEKFWDSNIGRTQSIAIEAHESFAAGSESAHVLTLTTCFANGVRLRVHGIFTYAVDAGGRITALRCYWSPSAMQVGSRRKAIELSTAIERSERLERAFLTIACCFVLTPAWCA